MRSCGYVFPSRKEGPSIPAPSKQREFGPPSITVPQSKPLLVIPAQERDSLQSPMLSCVPQNRSEKETPENFSQHGSGMTSAPDSSPPHCSGQPEVFPALAFCFACVGSSLLPVLYTRHAGVDSSKHAGL